MLDNWEYGERLHSALLLLTAILETAREVAVIFNPLLQIRKQTCRD